MGPFSLISFQRGLINSFEASLEVEPHGKIHNLIGGVMASLGTSPTDPIFWLHHAQIDRLWHAWAFADNGRTMPPLSDGYWSGVLTYGPDLILERNRVRDPRTYLGYTYTDETLPSSYPPPPEAALKGGMMRVAMKDEGSQRTSRPALDRIPERPPAVSFRAMEARPTGVNKRAIGGALDMTLGAESLTVNVAIGQDDRRTLQYISKNMQASQLANSESAESYSSVQVVLDNVRLTPAGKLGGYYYDVYLNLPNGGGSSQDKYLLGSFGPFEISTAQHHAMHQGENAARLVFPATQLLRNVPLAQTRELTVSFVRVSGEKSPKGPAVLLGEMRVELSTDEIE
jgi:tyrosinase